MENHEMDYATRYLIKNSEKEILALCRTSKIFYSDYRDKEAKENIQKRKIEVATLQVELMKEQLLYENAILNSINREVREAYESAKKNEEKITEYYKEYCDLCEKYSVTKTITLNDLVMK